MEKYKTGDKFIIELGEQVGDLWKIKGFRALTFDVNGLNKLGQLVQGIDKFSYNKGAEDALELVMKIEGLPIHALEDIFGEMFIGHMEKRSELFDTYTYAEAVAKVEAWEKEKSEIRVGDVVRIGTTLNCNGCVVQKIELENCTPQYAILVEGGGFVVLGEKHLTKIDRHIDIESILKQIGENHE